MIALFGGMFDPPHLGHMVLCQELFTTIGTEKVWVIPTGVPRLKSASVTSAAHRLALSKIAFEKSGAEVLDNEIRRAELTHQPTRTFDTLTELSRVPGKAVVIGTDQFFKLSQWAEFPKLLSLADWWVFKRAGESEEAIQLQWREWKASGLIRTELGRDRHPEALQTSLLREGNSLSLFATKAPQISGTIIRQHCEKTGKPPENMLSHGVIEYLLHHRLYGT